MKSFEKICAEMDAQFEADVTTMRENHEKETNKMLAEHRESMKPRQSALRTHGETERISGRRPMSFDVPVPTDAHLQLQHQQAHQQHVDQHQQFVNDTMMQQHIDTHHNF